MQNLTGKTIRNGIGCGRLVYVDEQTQLEAVFTEDVILFAEKFTAAQLIGWDKTHIRGLVAAKGSPVSHVAILANNYALPYLAGIEVDALPQELTAVLDADNGQLVLEPDAETLQEAQARGEAQRKADAQNLDIATRLKVFANISTVEDLPLVKDKHAEGIGIFRTEFLFMNRSEAPSEEEQYAAYREALLAMEGRTVIIRTADIGTDKPVEYLHMPQEINPALGLRGVRVSLADLDFFQTQLRALLRAAVHGSLSVMFPMIASVEEIALIKEQIKLAEAALQAEGVPYGSFKTGIMIETPAAAVCSEELGSQVDFFSIGTNDLTQYTLALDRQAEGLDSYYNAHHPAVLRLIEMTVRGGHANNIPVGICGQLGADTELMPFFTRIGLDEVSVPAASIPAVKAAAFEAENVLEP